MICSSLGSLTISNLHGFHHFGILCLCIVGICRGVSTGKVSHECCSSTVFYGLGILSLHGVLDDLGLFHLHCVNVVLGVYVHNLFNGSLLDLVLKYPIFGWSLRVRELQCDFRNSGDLLLLSTGSDEI